MIFGCSALAATPGSLTWCREVWQGTSCGRSLATCSNIGSPPYGNSAWSGKPGAVVSAAEVLHAAGLRGDNSMFETNQQLAKIFATVVERNPGEPEFNRAVKEVLESLAPVLHKYPELGEKKIIERIWRCAKEDVSWPGLRRRTLRSCAAPRRALHLASARSRGAGHART